MIIGRWLYFALTPAPFVERTILNFTYTETQTRHFKAKWQRSLFKRVTRHALPLFLRPADQISMAPIVDGIYEPDIKHLLEHLAATGHHHFLIDIGANIGLSSCQSGEHFNEIHLFEPNPNCLHILHVNTRIALRSRPYTIHEYALGARQETLQLFVPAHNWGGAFIRSADNDYDETVLAGKDRYARFDPKNYDIFEVQVEPATEKLQQLFIDLQTRQGNCGTIKIDVEGYEKQILGAIAQALPPGMSVYIIFENWKEDLDLADTLAQPGLSHTLYTYGPETPAATQPRWLTRLKQWATNTRSRTVLRPAPNTRTPGNYLLHLART